MLVNEQLRLHLLQLKNKLNHEVLWLRKSFFHLLVASLHGLEQYSEYDLHFLLLEPLGFVCPLSDGNLLLCCNIKGLFMQKQRENRIFWCHNSIFFAF